MALTFLVLTGLAAIGDWAAVARRYFRIEYLLKPLTLAFLAVAAASADLGPGHWWIVAGLGFGLVGDIALLGAGDRTGAAFLTGLAAFGLGHVCYLIGFGRHGLHLLYALAGVLVVAGVAGLVLPAVLRAARTHSGLVAPLAGYCALLGAMTVLAVATGSIATAIGGVLFLVSDAVLAHDRFVRRLPRGPLTVITTYHVGQFLVVAGLVEHL